MLQNVQLGESRGCLVFVKKEVLYRRLLNVWLVEIGICWYFLDKAEGFEWSPALTLTKITIRSSLPFREDSKECTTNSILDTNNAVKWFVVECTV
jgi:hypothetical protein